VKTWFTITNKAEAPAAEIDIFDEIGLWGVSTKDFANALKSVPMDREISLRINSPGGSVFDGFAIHDMLAARRDKVTARIIGVAASMASIIALAGKRTIASENSTVMIHKPRGGAFGESEEMRKMADLLDKLEGRLVNVYAAKSGKKEDEVKAAMEATTWFTAEEAKAWGLVDEVSAPVKAAACFDLSRLGPVPDRITNLFTGGVTASTNHQTQVSMKNLLAVLVEAKLIASADLSDDAAAAQVRAAFANQASQLKAAQDENTSLKAQLEKANKGLAESLTARAEAAVDAAVKVGKIKDDKNVRAKWIESYVANEESTKTLIASLAEVKAQKGSAPIVTDKSPEDKTERQSTASVWAKQFSNS
jgi:ATP-dependent Clp endopeptidase proteolytic subunit ClpP